MNPIDLTTLIPRCHEASKANGWWEPRPNAGQQLMLVVSELSEALEADRNGKDKTGLPSYYALLAEAEAGGQAVWGEATSLEQRRQELFKWKVKDTVADELADAYIRLCDYAGGFSLRLSPIVRHHAIEKMEMDKCPDNLGECLLGLTGQVYELHYEAHKEENMGIALAGIEHVCKHFGIDLATHIDLKLRYNATRGQKHGNKAY